MISPQWLRWAQEIQALAQTSCHYAENDYQRQRAQRLVAIAAEIVSTHTTRDNKATEKIYLAPVGYATPRVDVRAAGLQDGKLLMVRECQDGGWTLPGGWADVGDTPSEASEREVWEEAGFRVKAQRVIGGYDANRTGRLELFHAF